MNIQSSPRKPSGPGDDQALSIALSDFVLKTMDRPLTEGRIARFLRKWRLARGVDFERMLEIRVRALLSLQQ